MSKRKTHFLLILFLSFFLFNTGPLFANETEAKNSSLTEKTIKVEINKNGELYEIKDIRMIDSGYKYYLDYFELRDMHNGNVVSFKDSALGHFPAPQMRLTTCVDYFGDETLEGGCFDSDTGIIRLDIPYFKNGKYAKIYDTAGKNILTIDLTSIAICNEDGNCDKQETIKDCPDDCELDNPSNKLTQSEQKPQQAEKNNYEKNLIFWILVTILVIAFLAITGIVFYVKYLERKKE